MAIARAAGWGAVAGAPLLLLKTWAAGEAMPADSSAFSGFLIGGMVLGAFLFAVIAAVAGSLRS